MYRDTFTQHKLNNCDKQKYTVFDLITADTHISAQLSNSIHHLYNFDPLKPHFYTVKPGFTRVPYCTH